MDLCCAFDGVYFRQSETTHQLTNLLGPPPAGLHRLTFMNAHRVSTPSAERFVRLPLPQLCDLRLMHLCSEVDLERSAAAKCGEGATILGDITGYSEWVSDSTPVVSVGWDWSLGGARGQLSALPVSIRTNLILVDASGRELGFSGTTHALFEWLSTWDWQSVVLKHVGGWGGQPSRTS